MNLPKSKKSTWPKQSAIVVSDSPNVHLLMRELLRSYSWTAVDSTASVQTAIKYIANGQASLVIIDDTPSVQVTREIRHMLANPLTVCTPTLAMLLDSNRHERKAISRIGRPEVVDKPLTPSKFTPGFVALVKRWEKEPYLSLRNANYQFITKKGDGQGFRSLSKLLDAPEVSAMAAQALALHLRRIGKLKEAENLLIAALKKSPRDLGIMIALAELYMCSAMPNLAHRLLLGARTAYPDSLAIVPDLVQAALQMGNLQDAINSLYMLQQAGVAEHETITYLARLLYAEGRDAEAERILYNNKAVFNRLQSEWTQAEMQPLNAAS